MSERDMQVLTIMTPPDAESLQRAEAFVQGLAPSARRTYVVGGTQRFELPMSEVFLFRLLCTLCACVGDSMNIEGLGSKLTL